MKNFNKIKELVTQVSGQINNYERRATKAESARIRKSLNEIKKLVTPTKAELLNADKA